jgi:RNA polymerase sigma-70 factor (ECF subfamily)
MASKRKSPTRNARPILVRERVRPAPFPSAHAPVTRDARVTLDQQEFENSRNGQPRPLHLLNAARAGDPDAFRALVDPHRVELHAHCHRMLGSTHDAEDAFQDAMLRAWHGLAGLIDGRRLRPWLYKIATNTCLDIIRRRPRHALPIGRGSSADTSDEPVRTLNQSPWVERCRHAWLGDADRDATPEAHYEQREAVALAVSAALEHLPGRQRAVLILREVLALSAREVAQLLETTVPSVNSTLQRARKTINERIPEPGTRLTLRSPNDERLRDLIERFVDAFETGDVDEILTMLVPTMNFAVAVRTGCVTR